MSPDVIQYPDINSDAWRYGSQCWDGVKREEDVPFPRIVTPFHHLQLRAQEIARGACVRERLTAAGVEFSDIFARMREDPGRLEVRAELPHQGSGSMSWAVFFQEAGDPHSHGFFAGRPSPAEALADMIDAIEEHTRTTIAVDQIYG